jgi:hypothetical protein
MNNHQNTKASTIKQQVVLYAYRYLSVPTKFLMTLSFVHKEFHPLVKINNVSPTRHQKILSKIDPERGKRRRHVKKCALGPAR